MEPKYGMRFGGDEDEGHPLLILWQYDCMTRVSNEEKAVTWHGENVLHFEASMNVTLGVPRIKETRQFGGMRR